MIDVIVYSEGIVSLSVCAHESLAPAEVVRQANAVAPTELDHPWALAEEGQFADGTPMPAPCDRRPGRRHYLLHC